jgi:hypothetical protein
VAEHRGGPESGARGRSGTGEALFLAEGDRHGPVVVVHHIQKTAGSSLRSFVRANFPGTEVGLDPDVRSVVRRREELLAWYRDWYESLEAERRAGLCCVMSHWAGYLLPALDQEADALTLVREPVDRTLSYYYFKQRRRGPDRPLPPLVELYERGLRGALGKPGNELWDQLCNWQSRALLSVFYDVSSLGHDAGPSGDASMWRGRLRALVEDVFLVGVQDRFEQYVEMLARRYGWRALVPRSKVNPKRPATEPSDDLRRTILAYNWLDAELYELCRSVQQRREREEAA